LPMPGGARGCGGKVISRALCAGTLSRWKMRNLL